MEMPLASILFFLVLVGLLVIPGFFRRHAGGDFFLGGRRAGTLTVAGSLVATCIGASATSGLVERAYLTGWGTVWWLGAGSLGLALLGLFWVGVMRAQPTTRTLPEWAGQTYGLPARVLAAGVIDVMWLAVIAAQWTAAGSILAVLWGWPLELGIVVSGLCVIGYTMVGGQGAVLRTDRWQVGFLVLALCAAGVCVWRLGGGGESSPAPVFRLDGIVSGSFLDWLSLVVVVGGMYVVGPDLCSRILVAHDLAAARRGALLAALAVVPIAFLTVGIGVAVRNTGLGPDSSLEVLPWLITRSGVVPAWAGALINAGLLAAMLSSADTCLLTAVSVLELDLLGRSRSHPEQERRGRVWLGLLGILSVLLACLRPQIIPNMLLAYAFYTGGLLVPLLLLAWPRLARRIPRPGVWLGIVAGGLTPVVLLASGWSASSSRAGLGGCLVCFVVLAGAALAGRLKERSDAP